MRLKISYDHYINTLILLFCIAVVFKRTAMDVVFLTASITGIYWAVKDRVLPYQISEIRLLTWLFWGYFITVISAIIAHPRSIEVLDFLTRELYFLLWKNKVRGFYLTLKSLVEILMWRLVDTKIRPSCLAPSSN